MRAAKRRYRARAKSAKKDDQNEKAKSDLVESQGKNPSNDSADMDQMIPLIHFGSTETDSLTDGQKLETDRKETDMNDKPAVLNVTTEKKEKSGEGKVVRFSKCENIEKVEIE